jgi:hypothetical protein
MGEGEHNETLELIISKYFSSNLHIFSQTKAHSTLRTL